MERARSTYEVHFGTPTHDGGTAIQSSLPRGVGQNDFDRDGQVDVMFTTIQIGIFKTIRMIIGAVLTRRVSSYQDKPPRSRGYSAGRRCLGELRLLAFLWWPVHHCVRAKGCIEEPLRFSGK